MKGGVAKVMFISTLTQKGDGWGEGVINSAIPVLMGAGKNRRKSFPNIKLKNQSAPWIIRRSRLFSPHSDGKEKRDRPHSREALHS